MHKWHFFLVHLKLLFIIIWIYCIKTKSLEKICLLHILNRQYRSLLVPTSCEQTEIAKSQLKTAPQASKTVVVEGSKFITAEARHQKNRLRRDPAMVRCLVQSGHEDFTSSYLATRLNGWELNFCSLYIVLRFLGGKGTMAQFNKEWQDLGLNKDQASHIRKAIIKRNWVLFSNYLWRILRQWNDNWACWCLK